MIGLKQRKFPIKVYLQSTIFDDKEKEQHKITGRGHFLARGNFEVLSFTEKLADHQQVNHLITMRRDQVHIKQSGARKMNQQFMNQQKTESMIRLPEGNLYMEIFTKDIIYQSMTDENPGKLMIHYQATLNDQVTRKHQLVITFHKEDVT